MRRPRKKPATANGTGAKWSNESAYRRRACVKQCTRRDADITRLRASLSKPNEVGYRKPPKAGQFRKCESGNKKGRRKGTKKSSELVVNNTPIAKSVITFDIPNKLAHSARQYALGNALYLLAAHRR